MDNKPIDKHKNYTSCEQREIAIKKWNGTVFNFKCLSKHIQEIIVWILLSVVVTLDTYSCMDPGIPVNGIRLSHDLSIGSTMSFQCDTGYRLSHEEPLVCEKNHFWSHPLPTCDGMYTKCFIVHSSTGISLIQGIHYHNFLLNKCCMNLSYCFKQVWFLSSLNDSGWLLVFKHSNMNVIY